MSLTQVITSINIKKAGFHVSWLIKEVRMPGDNSSNIAVKMSQAIGIEIMIFTEVIEKV